MGREDQTTENVFLAGRPEEPVREPAFGPDHADEQAGGGGEPQAPNDRGDDQGELAGEEGTGGPQLSPGVPRARRLMPRAAALGALAAGCALLVGVLSRGGERSPTPAPSGTAGAERIAKPSPGRAAPRAERRRRTAQRRPQTRERSQGDQEQRRVRSTDASRPAPSGPDSTGVTSPPPTARPAPEPVSGGVGAKPASPEDVRREFSQP